MLALSAKDVEFRGFPDETKRSIVRLTDKFDRLPALRCDEGFLVKTADIPDGFRFYLAFPSVAPALDALPADVPKVVLPEALLHLGHGDIVRLSPAARAVRVLYRRNSSHNSFLTTERCNHYCLMCSQPPKDHDDSWLIDEILEVIPLIDPDTAELGLTGGEPTLLGDRFLRVLRTARNFLPRTALHVLSNGRRFSDPAFAAAYADVRHPDIMVGIPLYSDVSTIHDYVVQAPGAFDETIRGILNLKRLKQRVEVRVVVHKQTYPRLPRLAEFLARNLPFVDQVALMGLEMTGFTKTNLDDLWVDPFDYQRELYQAATLLADCRINVSIFNHQLCVVDQRLWPLCRRSISDWKNEYMPQCSGCTQRHACGGFFSSAKLRYSDHIRPIG